MDAESPSAQPVVPIAAPPRVVTTALAAVGPVAVDEERSAARTSESGASEPARIVGPASWYPTFGRVAAAGPRLRHFLGHGWRGTRIVVCRTTRSSEACTIATVVDWCKCPHGRIVDLSDDVFGVLAPVSVGVIRVSIRRLNVALPATDTP